MTPKKKDESFWQRAKNDEKGWFLASLCFFGWACMLAFLFYKVYF